MSMAATTIYKTISDQLDQPLTAFADAAVSSLTTYVATPLKVGVTLYFVTFGILIMRGAHDGSFSEFIQRCLKLCALAMVLSPGWYQEHITKFVMVQLPNELATAITSNGQPASGSSFDRLNDYGHNLAAIAWGKASVTSPGGYLHWAVVVATTSLFCAVGFFVVTYAKISLALLVALGPLFVATFLFQQSRPIGEAWIKTLISFVCLHVLAAGLGALVIKVAYASFETTTAMELPGRVGAFMSISFVGMLTLGSLPHIAQMLGGAGIGFASAAGGAANWVGNKALSAGQATARGAAMEAWRSATGGSGQSQAAANAARSQAVFNSSPQGRAMNEQTAALRQMGEAMRASGEVAAPTRASTGQAS